MYLSLLLITVVLLTITSLITSGYALASVWAVKNSTHQLQMVSPLSEEGVPEERLDKFNKKEFEKFEQEYLSVLESRGM